MRHINLVVQYHSNEDVYRVFSPDLPGFNVECDDKDGVFDLSRELAVDFLRLDGEIGPEEKVSFDFEVRD